MDGSRAREPEVRSEVVNFVDRFSKSTFLALSRRAPMLGALFFKPIARKAGVKLVVRPRYCDVRQGNRAVRLAHRHQIYLKDVARNFDYYFSAVAPERIDGIEVVDYSSPRWHQVAGYERHPILFASLAEPIETAQQYIDFAQLEPGDVVLDLGAYSGLTSLLFDQIVGPGGRVIAVDADEQNIDCVRQNLARYREATGRSVEAVYGAMWREEGEVSFVSEGSMGSSVSGVAIEGRGTVRTVKAYTLSSLAKAFQLSRVDFIKCDIEGAETAVFDQPEFFDRFRPRIIIEAHVVDGVMTTEACASALAKYGYRCREVDQPGATLPLVECVPG